VSIFRRDPAAPGANVGRLGPLGPVAEDPLGQGVARFNASEAARTVGGLIRSLGAPWVSVGAVAGSTSEVRITIAWDLCWYQWGVDLADGSRPVFPIDTGSEVEQLDGSARQWNARCGDRGVVALGVPVG
jgi:hypothetical protein